MLIYVNNFLFEPEQGSDQIIQLVTKWVGQRVKSYVDADRLACGVRQLKFKDGSVLSSRSTLSDDGQKSYPFLFCAQFSHRDEKVSGRRWVTEVGLRQEAEDQTIECSLLLRTDEVSTRVTAPAQATRPKLVEQLIASCNPVGKTPGLKDKYLTQESAAAFLHEIEHDTRSYPVVVLSVNADGKYPVESKRLRSILVGLADVVCVPAGEDTFAIENVVGRRFMAFGGAINVVFPGRQGEHGRFHETVKLHPEEMFDLFESGSTIESTVLSVITHRTNLPYSWRHISREKVEQAVFRARSAQVIERLRENDLSKEVKELLELLEHADQEFRLKEGELADIQSRYEDKEQENRELRATNDSFKYVLQASHDGKSDIDETSFSLLRDAIAAVAKGNPSLQQTMDVISTLYSERIVLLPSVRSSAKESDQRDFRKGGKAFELLQKLVTDYWQQLADGHGDQQAMAVFGKNEYSAKEAKTLSNHGKDHRTFEYAGHTWLMEKHLKIGVKDSLAETLRIHFEWFPDEQKIVVGHCGKHLPL